MSRISNLGTALLLAGLTACSSLPAVKGHLSATQVESLFSQDAIDAFWFSRRGPTIVILGNGEIFTADLPASPAYDNYVRHREQLRRPVRVTIE